MATEKSTSEDEHREQANTPVSTPSNRPSRSLNLCSTTEWSLVLAAGNSQSPDAREALASLCQTYWYPVYALIRQTCRDTDKAQDLTQGFFAHLLEKQFFKTARPERGRFRFFLRAAVRHYLAHERRRERAKKLGGGQAALALDFTDAESRFGLEPADQATPEKAFEERWARTLLTRTLQRLRTEMREAGAQERLNRLEPFLTARPVGPRYRQVAEELEISESAVKVIVHRMRHRFGDLLREEVARTVDDPGEVDEEIRYLFSVLE